MSTCTRGIASVIAKRKVKKDNKCVDESRRIADIRCDEKCTQNIEGQKVSGKCEKNYQLLFKISTTLQGNICHRNISYLGKVSCIKCQKSTFEIPACEKNSKNTFLLKTYYRNDNGTCIKKSKKIKEISCKCHETTKKNLTVTIGKTCEKGFKSRELVIQEERQGKCVDVKFTLRRIKCSIVCLRLKFRVTKCKSNKRELVKLRGTRVGEKCEWKVIEKREVKCENICPKSTRKTTICIRGKQALLEVTFKEKGDFCKGYVKKIKISKCNKTKGCRNRTYEVSKCDKNDKTTFLVKTFYQSVNGTCVKKIRKVKELSCKCYQTTKTNITVIVGKTCEKRFKSRELVIQEERQGKCVDVKFTLRRRFCITRCLKREYKVTKCVNNKREVSKYRKIFQNGICEWKLVFKKIFDCKTNCPADRRKLTKCIFNKQALLEIKFKEEGAYCKSNVIRLKLQKCKKPKKCGNTTFEVGNCGRNDRLTFLNRTYYVNVNGTCVKKMQKVKELSCKCYESRSRDIVVTVNKICQKGERSREIVLHEERQGQCTDIKFQLRKIKCKVRCLIREFKMSKCINNKREIIKYQESKVVNRNKCQWKIVEKKMVYCKNPCPNSKRTVTRCVLGKQALLEVTFKEEAEKCKSTVVRLKLMKCNTTKVCRNSTYGILKCDKNAKTTFLIRNYYESLNNTCIMKSRKVRQLPCKCYENTKANLTIMIGKKCEKGFKSREIVLIEERQGKCINVKMTLRKIICEIGCGEVKTVPGPCTNQKRIVKSYEKLSINGSCIWKYIRESSVNCTNACPQPKISETPCLLGKKALIRKTYHLIGKSCIPKIQKLRVLDCKNCPKRSFYKVENCTKGLAFSNLVRISFKDCKQQVEVLKKVDCSCYQLNRNTLKISVASQCLNGTKTRTVFYFDKGKSICEQNQHIIRGIKCGCYGRSVVMSICKNGNRTLTFNKKETINGKCEDKKLYTKSMRCKTVCPNRMVHKSKCINKRTFEATNEYQQVGEICKVINYQIKWSNCSLVTNNTTKCSKKVKLIISTCVNNTAYIIAKRQMEKNNKCAEESRRIAAIDCDARKCERTIKPKLVAARCEKNLKFIFHISTMPKDNKCYHKILYLGTIKCKDC